MDTQEPAANPAAEPIDAPSAEGPINLDAAPEANTPAVGSDAEPDPIEELTKEALGSDDLANLEPELVEVELDGKKIKVSAEGKDFLLRQADYTRKTMDLAEQRKSFETQRQQFEAVAKQSTEELQATFALTQLNSQIDQLSQTSIAGMSQEQINGLRLDLQDLVRQRDDLNHRLNQHFEQKTRAESENIAKSRAAAIEEAAKMIPNFTDTRRQELESLAVSLGLPEDVVKGEVSPAEWQIMHYADIGKKFIERQRHAAQMKAAQAGTPATKVAGAASGGKTPDEMSMEEYIAARSAGTI